MSTINRQMAKAASMQELLDAAIASRSKVASDAVGTSTSSGITITKEDKPVVEGAVAKEHDAHFNDALGPMSPVGGAPAGDSRGDLNPPMQASTLAPAGEDPAQEKKVTTMPAGVDSGTSLPGGTLGGSTIETKIASWAQRTSEVLAKLAAEEVAPAKQEPAKKEAAQAEETVGESADNIYAKIAENADQAAAYHQMVSGTIAEAINVGREYGIKVAAYLNSIQKKAEEGEDEAGEPKSDESESGSSGPTTPSEPSKAPAEEAPAPESAASGGEMAGVEAAAGGGEMGGAPAGGGVEAALEILAGLSPEELQMVISALTGGGDPAAAGAPPMDPAAAGMPPMDPAAGAMSPEAAMGGEALPPEMMADPKLAGLVKIASKIAADRVAKKRAQSATSVLNEIVRRGSR
jgi:hypothetical protein